MAVIIDSPLSFPFRVLGVGSYSGNQDDLDVEADLRFYSKLVSLYVEDDSVLAQNARTRISSLDVCRATPIRVIRFGNPCVERRSAFRVLLGMYGLAGL